MDGGTLIGEIGGSSSRWAFLAPDGSTVMLPLKGDRVPGFNPVSGDGEAFAAVVGTYLADHCPPALHAAHVVLYGAGCGSLDRRERMEATLRPLWPAALMDVQTDIRGAATGLCGSSPSLVLILGTGMNAGHFDGRQLTQPMPSLGYVLGDEGSGADIGRALLQDAFYRRIPEEVHAALFGPDGPALAEVIDRVYRSPFPSRALASYTALLAPHVEQRYVRDLILSRFHAMAELLVNFFPPEQREEVRATGSVAWGFKELLAECLLDRGMTLTVVERDPLPGLVEYHRGRATPA
jgi:N-acetylglucosamine kinase-like BadF-type ATPase